MNKLFNYNNFLRFIARYLDYSIYLLIILFLNKLSGLKFEKFISITFFIPLILLISIFIESAILFKYQTTLGKTLFGIKILNKKNDYFIYLKRSWLVFVYGMASGLTILVPFFNILSYIYFLKNNKTYWDKVTDFNIEIKQINIFIRLIIFWFILMVLSFGYGILLKSEMNKYSNNVNKISIPTKEIIIGYPVNNSKEIIDVNKWIKACLQGGMNFAKNNNYEYNEEYLKMFCEQAGTEYAESEDEATELSACTMGFSYIYTQQNGVDQSLIEKNFDKFKKIINESCSYLLEDYEQK